MYRLWLRTLSMPHSSKKPHQQGFHPEGHLNIIPDRFQKVHMWCMDGEFGVAEQKGNVPMISERPKQPLEQIHASLSDECQTLPHVQPNTL